MDNAIAIDTGILDEKMLDSLHMRLCAGQVKKTMETLVNALFDYRAEHSVEDWKEFVNNTALAHPIREFVHKDPFVSRSFSKPRGYSGDAVMLDMVYQRRFDDGDQSDRIKNELFDFGIGRPAPSAVRNRAQKLAQLIDEAVARRADARILALAAGHLREIEMAKVVAMSFRGEIIALDQDAESLAVVERDYSGKGVKTVRASVRHLLAGKLDLQGFDLVYAAGLFDYLSQLVAKALSENMFGMLNPGGRMLIANFVPDIPDVGYMESFMDWQLIYRDEAAMRDLVADLPTEQVEQADISFDETRNIVYLTVTKRAQGATG